MREHVGAQFMEGSACLCAALVVNVCGGGGVYYSKTITEAVIVSCTFTVDCMHVTSLLINHIMDHKS